MQESEGLLGIGRQIQIAGRVIRQLLHLEPVVAEEKIGLVQTVLPQQRRSGQPVERCARDRLECAEIGAFQPVIRIQADGGTQNVAVGFLGRADDELGGVTDARLPADISGNATESAHDFGGEVFAPTEPGQMGGGRRFHVQRDPVGELHGFFRFRFPGAGQNLQMDVAAEFITEPQDFHSLQQFLHRPSGRVADAGTEEESFHIVAAIEFHEQPGQFLRRKPTARHVATGPVGAIQAVFFTVVAQQDLEQGNTTAVRRERMADPAGNGAADVGIGEFFGSCGRRSTDVIFGAFAEQSEFFELIHLVGLLPAVLFSNIICNP